MLKSYQQQQSPDQEQPLLRGDRVRVRPASVILATLDEMGALEKLPFIPEMVKLIGREGVVRNRALRSCVEGHEIRGFDNTVLVEGMRCDGAAHDGCQRQCLFFWKEDWLERADQPKTSVDPAVEAAALEKLLALPTRLQDRYYCQSTELVQASVALPSKTHWGLMFREWRLGEMSFSEFVEIIYRAIINQSLFRLKIPGLGVITGPKGRKSKGDLNLKVGERVRIKNKEALSRTLNEQSKNSGLKFEPEMTGYIGGIYEVNAVIEKIILEETGQMIELQNTVSLKNVLCEGQCAKQCPRANPLFWREAWLERVKPVTPAPAKQPGKVPAGVS